MVLFFCFFADFLLRRSFMPHGSPAPWPPGPSSTVFPRTSCALYFVWCPHLWLERHWRQSLQGTTKGELIKTSAHERIQIIRQFLLFPQRISPNGWMRLNDSIRNRGRRGQVLQGEVPRGYIPAICTDPSSPRRIFPALRSLRKHKKFVLYISRSHADLSKTTWLKKAWAD